MHNVGIALYVFTVVFLAFFIPYIIMCMKVTKKRRPRKPRKYNVITIGGPRAAPVQ